MLDSKGARRVGVGGGGDVDQQSIRVGVCVSYRPAQSKCRSICCLFVFFEEGVERVSVEGRGQQLLVRCSRRFGVGSNQRAVGSTLVDDVEVRGGHASFTKDKNEELKCLERQQFALFPPSPSLDGPLLCGATPVDGLFKSA